MTRWLGTSLLGAQRTSGELLKLIEKGIVTKRPTGACVPAEIRERLPVITQECAPVRKKGSGGRSLFLVFCRGLRPLTAQSEIAQGQKSVARVPPRGPGLLRQELRCCYGRESTNLPTRSKHAFSFFHDSPVCTK